MADGKSMHLSMADKGMVFLPFSWSRKFDSEQNNIHVGNAFSDTGIVFLPFSHPAKFDNGQKYNPRRKCILRHTDRVFAILVVKEIANE
jgi:hypothetical protein